MKRIITILIATSCLYGCEVKYEGEYLHFKAETSFYDWETSSWQDGTMNLTYRHN